LQKTNIYSDLISAKLAFMVSKWRHRVTQKLGCFLAFEKSDLASVMSLNYNRTFIPYKHLKERNPQKTILVS